ncbi:TniB family NTP-binding protein [Streptomyces mirabilis]|uniref:TniB family NTP-binding protein n=1 Tax=Streptomyces mirabilis TaxID=68239 RepID=UPI00332B760C
MVVNFPEFGMADERRLPTTTLEGWRRFVNADPLTFDLLPADEWQSLEPSARHEYDEARVNYHSELIVVETPTIREVAHQGRLLTLVNRREISARRGLIVSGPWATGKSTAIKQLGRIHELRVRQRFPDHDRIPVVYVSAPPNGSPRKLATRFAHFLGLPLKSRHNEMDIADTVCQILTDARCDLVCVDEIHNINMATSTGKDMSDHLKYFTEHIPATFVYAGINVEREGLFSGVRGRQIAARCVMRATGNFPDTAEWQSMIATMEHALRLHRHPSGTLPGQAKYLYQRTGGSISSLSHLIRAAAISAIIDGSERITRVLLDSVPVDHSTQSDNPAPSDGEDDGIGDAA